ncbi:tyrosine-type recombinase/integrase [Candidatus Nanohalococcus occultus]|uniref:tyrosine-type recombinase/integrase n=1 Tax=Candidatus Nanohalococcus occultus TaxID=2978047 RepID=UPI0039E092A0
MVAGINQLDQHSVRTQADLRSVLKDYYKLVQGDGKGCPEKADFIKAYHDESEVDSRTPLDKSVIQDIINECQNDRDRAMYKLLYEGGLRPGELMALTVGDIEPKDKGVTVRVPNVKTGDRTILVVESERYLKDWLRKHPFPDRDDAPLWTKIRNVGNETPQEIALGYDHMRLKLKEIAREKDILTYWDVERDKHRRPNFDEDGNEIPVKRTEVVPYTLRHSRATHLATELREATMKEYFGWTQGSDMTEVYIHLSGKDIDREIMKMYGIEEEEEENEKQECGRCNKEYKGTENFCPRCGKAFDYEAELDRDTVQESSKAVTSEKLSGMEETEEEKLVKKVIEKMKEEA